MNNIKQDEQFRIERNKREAERQKKSGYSAQKKYRASHVSQVRESARKSVQKYRQKVKGTPEEIYIARVALRAEFKPLLMEIVSIHNTTINNLFLDAVEEKYHVLLHRKNDNE